MKEFFSDPRKIVVMLVIIILFLFYEIITKAIKTMLITRVKEERYIKRILNGWRIIFFLIISLFLYDLFGGKLATTGLLSAAFLGMILGWSLQAPITGLAAWLFVIILKPFKIGDRIIISAYGLIGDVKKIGLMYITLEQVGGTVGGEETSGRAILIPNILLFSQVFINYTLRDKEMTKESKYILDEIPVRITYESDWDTAEKILIDAATQVTEKIIKETGKKPFVRAEFLDWGFLMRLRYMSTAIERPEISTKIIKILFYEFANNPKIEFCYPHSEVIYRNKDGNAIPFEKK